jgi:hypothetical protein
MVRWGQGEAAEAGAGFGVGLALADAVDGGVDEHGGGVGVEVELVQVRAVDSLVRQPVPTISSPKSLACLLRSFESP